MKNDTIKGEKFIPQIKMRVCTEPSVTWDKFPCVELWWDLEHTDYSAPKKCSSWWTWPAPPQHPTATPVFAEQIWLIRDSSSICIDKSEEKSSRRTMVEGQYLESELHTCKNGLNTHVHTKLNSLNTHKNYNHMHALNLTGGHTHTIWDAPV